MTAPHCPTCRMPAACDYAGTCLGAGGLRGIAERAAEAWPHVRLMTAGNPRREPAMNAYLGTFTPSAVLALLDALEAKDAALEPFAKIADLCTNAPDDRFLWSANAREADSYTLTLGHARAARAALERRDG